MRFDYSQQMKLGQHMKLAPRMIQSMEVLQMAQAELAERLEQELENNPTLEMVDGDEEGQNSDSAGNGSASDTAQEDRPLNVDDRSGADDFARLDSYEQSNPEAFEGEYDRSAPTSTPREELEYGPTRRVRDDGERDGKMDAMASAPARSASLVDQLREQWGLAEVAPEIRALGELIIGFIEDDGYLRTSLETIADRAPADAAKPTIAELERALQAVQLFLEPAGVGARDTRECLLLQLDAIEDEPGRDAEQRAALAVARTLIDAHLDDLAKNRLPRIAEKSGLSIDDIKRGVLEMKRLSLAPARALVNDQAAAITPDAIVEYDEEHDRYVPILTDGRLPRVRINEAYEQWAADRARDKKEKEFIRTNLSNARWLLDAIEQRRRTLQRVLNVVVDAQREFFDYGPQAVKPLPMTQVAEQLGIHVATVSRAVAEKYIQTPRGVFPLRRFFTGGMETASGEEMSYDAIKAALTEVIAAEDKSKPLSDDALVGELKKRGIEIARRTVAKYRDQLGVPTARLRKAY